MGVMIMGLLNGVFSGNGRRVPPVEPERPYTLDQLDERLYQQLHGKQIPVLVNNKNCEAVFYFLGGKLRLLYNDGRTWELPVDRFGEVEVLDGNRYK